MLLVNTTDNSMFPAHLQIFIAQNLVREGFRAQAGLDYLLKVQVEVQDEPCLLLLGG